MRLSARFYQEIKHHVTKTRRTWIISGAIIGDGDLKSRDPRGPMIWDNFSIFRTNFAILTSYIRANPRTRCGFSRVCCHVAWSKMVRVASFHSEGKEWGREEEPVLFYALLRSVVSFSGWEISFISRLEWISARACCTRKLLRLLSKKTLHSGMEFISEFPKEWLIITKILFCRVSYCFCLFWEFAKVFERQVRCHTSSSFA